MHIAGWISQVDLVNLFCNVKHSDRAMAMIITLLYILLLIQALSKPLLL
jgi:hypothetical protein